MITWVRTHQAAYKKEVPFIALILTLCGLAYVLYPHPKLAMWFGFAVAGYSALANDSIQTLGTFLSSNKRLPWWVLWLFIGGILVLTFAVGWSINDGDPAFGRLTRIPQPDTFTFVTLAAPIILLILTRLKMPVSTTFLLLAAFSSSVVIKKMLTKTLFGYGVAFGVAIVVWSIIAILTKRNVIAKTYNKKVWRTLQTCSTSVLWWAWLMQDTANVSVFLPRSLSFNQLIVAVVYLFFRKFNSEMHKKYISERLIL